MKTIAQCNVWINSIAAIIWLMHIGFFGHSLAAWGIVALSSAVMWLNLGTATRNHQ